MENAKWAWGILLVVDIEEALKKRKTKREVYYIQETEEPNWKNFNGQSWNNLNNQINNYSIGL